MWPFGTGELKIYFKNELIQAWFENCQQKASIIKKKRRRRKSDKYPVINALVRQQDVMMVGSKTLNRKSLALDINMLL